MCLRPLKLRFWWYTCVFEHYDNSIIMTREELFTNNFDHILIVKKSSSSVEKRLQWHRACLSHPPFIFGLVFILGVGSGHSSILRSLTNIFIISFLLMKMRHIIKQSSLFPSKYYSWSTIICLKLPLFQIMFLNQSTQRTQRLRKINANYVTIV